MSAFATPAVEKTKNQGRNSAISLKTMFKNGENLDFLWKIFIHFSITQENK